MLKASFTSPRSRSSHGSRSRARGAQRRARWPDCTTRPTMNVSSPTRSSPRSWSRPCRSCSLDLARSGALPMRYLPLEPADRAAMLAKIGAAAIDDLFAAVPKGKLLTEPVNLPKAKGELEVERELMKLSRCSTPAGTVPFFVGCGAYRHHVPATVDHLIQRSEFLTSYTPYQPEISQGTLQVLFEFQTQVA